MRPNLAQSSTLVPFRIGKVSTFASNGGQASV